MFRKLGLIMLAVLILDAYAPAQTTNGLITGVIADSSGAVVVDAQVDITNQGTGLLRSSTSGNNGIYLLPQLPPGIYNVSVKKQGFATENRENVQLEVNQSVTLDFKLAVSSTAQNITVTGAAPLLNTTSPTLSDVINHAATVDLPLNGREFTQLALLTPGVAPVEGAQQGSAFTVTLGAGGISPSVNGQKGQQNNFTMDGVLNNSIFDNVWSIAPPPDAIQEFNVQSHITDAQFAISSGANINVVTRSGTNAFHGALWEFLRNNALDAQTFPETARLPYRQNQYGLYFGGPFTIPHIINGKDNTWFSLYWEGFRSSQSSTVLSSTLTPVMRRGDFSGVLGAQVGTDSLGRPEYANEIYDPETSRPDPMHPGAFLRDPFSGNVIPANRLNPATALILQKYYPVPNLPVPEGVLPNYKFTGVTSTESDVFGIRMDHQFDENDTVFARFNRSNQHYAVPQGLPTVILTLSNYAQQGALGYTHMFSPKTILILHSGYTYQNDFRGYPPAGAAFADSINFTQALPAQNGIQLGPAISLTNGFAATQDLHNAFGPQEGMDYHLDLTKIIGNHTLGVGGMYYHIYSFDNNFGATLNFTQNATAQDAQAGPTGYAPASLMLGALDSYKPTIGNAGITQVVNWYGVYAQDQWQATKKLVLVAGLRWDYVSPPYFHKIVSGLNVLTGQFIVTGPVPPVFPEATGPEGYFQPQYNGYEPRFGFTYKAEERTVVHGAFAMLDDHNNSVVQENQSIRVSWPVALAPNLTSLDLGLPKTFVDNLPTPASLLSSAAPYASGGADPNNKIPYSMQYNFGVQQQLSNSTVLKLDYVGSLDRHQQIAVTANEALTPGPGAISARQPFPQYGGPFQFIWHEGPSSYNALQVHVQKSLSSGLFFLASYTWSKSLDLSSSANGSTEQSFYALRAEWGPSDFNLKHIFVLSGVYALPLGKGKSYLGNANPFLQAVAGNWNLGSIFYVRSGLPINVLAGSDVANVGSISERAKRIGTSPYAATQSPGNWLNHAAFTLPTAYTFGNEGRNDLVGPAYRDIDFNAAKNFPLWESTTLQFRAEFFNVFNQTNYANPAATVNASTFGKITGAEGAGREVQFALKVLF
jgi:hypothetical protein